MEKLRRKIGSGWDDARIAAVDLKWAAIDPADSIFDRLRAQTERLFTDGQLVQASVEAPSDTRAWLRAEMIRRFSRTGCGRIVVASYGAPSNDW